MAGDYGSFIGAFSYVGSGGYVKNAFLGRYCSIGHRVTIGASSHALDEFSTHPILGKGRSKFVQLGNDVWVGDGAVIMPGVVVGTGAVIGANAVVTKNVESYSIVAGVPAKHIRYRFDKETRDLLLDSKWWDYSHEYFLSLKNLHIENFLLEINVNPSQYVEHPTFKYFHPNS